MSVPNTTTFTFQDVTTEVYSDINVGRNLVSAFVDATGTFDPSYVGSKNQLLNFRNYCQLSIIRVLLISAGYANTEVIDSNNLTWGWGYNYQGQIGDNSTTDKCIPVSILGTKKTFCKISAGGEYLTVLDKNGQVWGWGYNNTGQLGINSLITKYTPVSILGTKKTFCEIESSWNSTLSIDNRGLVWGWGYNYQGVIGDNTNIERLTPVSILGAKKTFCKIAGGQYHTIALDKNSQVWGWGYNYYGQLGDNTVINRCTPVSILGTKKTFCNVSAGGSYTIGLDKNGQVWEWGNNYYGQLGDNSIINRCTPVSILGIKKTFCKITAGTYQALGIDNIGQVWGWGYNNYGQLGDNSTINRCTPVSILGIKKTFCNISAGGSHTIGIDKNGQVWGWGYNQHGQLGNGTTNFATTPIKVSFI